MKGQIRHNIETVGDFTSNEGDVVYAPHQHGMRRDLPAPGRHAALQ